MVRPLGVAARASTAGARHSDPWIARALAVIAAAPPTGLSAATLARRLRVSSEILRRRFQRHLGRPPREVLRRQRLSIAQGMLADEPTWSIARIARRCGWKTTSHFTADFRRAFGVTPARFRGGIDRLGAAPGDIEPVRATRSGSSSAIDGHPRP
jgi:transcriptional regulator GlxA family with amidase domain